MCILMPGSTLLIFLELFYRGWSSTCEFHVRLAKEALQNKLVLKVWLCA